MGRRPTLPGHTPRCMQSAPAQPISLFNHRIKMDRATRASYWIEANLRSLDRLHELQVWLDEPYPRPPHNYAIGARTREGLEQYIIDAQLQYAPINST